MQTKKSFYTVFEKDAVFNSGEINEHEANSFNRFSEIITFKVFFLNIIFKDKKILSLEIFVIFRYNTSPIIYVML